jgi:hypothetical protein
VRLELSDQERRAVSRALLERKTRRIEMAEDTTQTHTVRRSATLELSVISSVLRKLVGEK